LNKTIKIILLILLLISILISGCEKAPSLEEQPAQEQQINAENEVVIPSETKEETKPTEEETPVESALETILKEKVSFILGALPGAELNTKTGELTAKVGNEWGIEAGESIGWYVVGAFTMEKPDGVEEEQDAVGLSPEVIRKILNENKEKGIFKCPWPFNFQENKDIEIVELVSKQWMPGPPYFPNYIGIKYSEPVNFYAPFDSGEFNEVWENIPDEEKDLDFFSAQAFKNIVLNTDFGYKSEEMNYEIPGGIQCVFIDWKPLIELGDPRKLEDVSYDQDIIGEIEAGDLLGEFLPSTPNSDFLDAGNNPKFYDNPGKFQAVLIISDFFDNLPNASCLEKVLRLGEENKEVTVFIWPGNQRTAHEQSN